MTQQAANEEYQARDTLYKIDPDQRFFVYPKRKCLPAPNLANTNKAALQGCKLISQPTHFLQLPDGGSSLYYLNHISEVHPFLKSLLNLCEGLHRLHTFECAHMDIKQDNIVTKRLESGEYATRFIDLGLMIRIPDFAYSVQKYVYTDLYAIWPFETRYISMPPERIMQKDIDAFYQTLEKYKRSFGLPMNLYYNSDLIPILTLEFMTGVIAFLQSLSDKQRLAFLTQKTDMYSLGIVFINLAAQLGVPPLSEIGTAMMELDPRNRLSAGDVFLVLRDWLASIGVLDVDPVQKAIQNLRFNDPESAFYEAFNVIQMLDGKPAIKEEDMTLLQAFGVAGLARGVQFFLGVECDEYAQENAQKSFMWAEQVLYGNDAQPVFEAAKESLARSLRNATISFAYKEIKTMPLGEKIKALRQIPKGDPLPEITYGTLETFIQKIDVEVNKDKQNLIKAVVGAYMFLLLKPESFALNPTDFLFSNLREALHALSTVPLQAVPVPLPPLKAVPVPLPPLQPANNTRPTAPPMTPLRPANYTGATAPPMTPT